jgi:ABC-2 type transport system ATP-binding protein
MLDEPTNGLDPEGIQEVRALLRSLANNGTSVFVSSHLLSELELISDYLVMLRKGEVVFTGKMTDLMLSQQPIIIAKTNNEHELVKLLEIAQSAGHQASIRDGAVHVQGPADWAQVLNRAAFDAGITLSQLTPQLPNLEETFFEMTGEK